MKFSREAMLEVLPLLFLCASSINGQIPKSSITLNIGSPEDLSTMNTMRKRAFQFPSFPGIPSFSMPTFPPGFTFPTFPSPPSLPSLPSFTIFPSLPTDIYNAHAPWMPEKTVKYKFENGFKQDQEAIVHAAMGDIEKETCVKFEKASDFNIGHTVNFKSSQSKCTSRVGRQPLILSQDISLSEACGNNKGAVLHLLMQTLGVFPEHTRADRDSHITIVRQNAKEDKATEFEIQSQARTTVPYDFTSVAHYGIMAYSKMGDPTIVTKNPLDQGLLFIPRTKLSHMDKLKINTIYGCIDEWAKCNNGVNKCQNDGYLGKDCQCICPPGTEGDTCQNTNGTYTDALRSSLLRYNAVVNTSANISSIGYPSPQEPVYIYTRIVKAPKCNEIKVTINELNMNTRCSNKLCCREGLELTFNGSPKDSKIYCGQDLFPNTQFLSKGGEVVITYYKDVIPGNTKPGFSLTALFQPIPGCRA